MKQLALLGHGVVGSGVCDILASDGALLAQRSGCEFAVTHILTRRKRTGDCRFTLDFCDIERDPEAEIVVEVMGGLTPAYDYVRRALCAGKHVVTANKELMAEKGGELLALAQRHGVRLLCEASVGGGIPILGPMRHSLTANRFTALRGVLNGTTNYILSSMHAQGLSFSAALQRAQALGYAEADPTADVAGHDTCRKLCILASLAWGRHLAPSDVRCEGITSVTAHDVALAAQGGFALKLIGSAALREDGVLDALVAPRLVPQTSLLASLSGAYNALVCDTDNAGPVAFAGQGAGKLVTASAVWSDILACVQPLPAVEPPLWSDVRADAPAPWENTRFCWFVRSRRDAVSRLAAARGWRQLTLAACPDAAVLTPPLSYQEATQLLPHAALLRVDDTPDPWR